MAGDFNHPSRHSQYQEWIGVYGLWELTDPKRKTFSSGNSLDKFLFAQGGVLPAFFMGDSALDPEQCYSEAYYPGETGAEEEVGNHHPISLSLPTKTPNRRHDHKERCVSRVFLKSPGRREMRN